MGWGCLDDGSLLIAMQGMFDALVTLDHDLSHQQNLKARLFAVFLLHARPIAMKAAVGRHQIGLTSEVADEIVAELRNCPAVVDAGGTALPGGVCEVP